MTETYTCYAVVLSGASGIPIFASTTPSASRALFYRRQEAVEFRDELEQHGCSKGRVVKVTVEIKEVNKK